MEKLYFLNKLFWGILIITINIDIQEIDVLPNFLGWALILTGLMKLSRTMDLKNLLYITFLQLSISVITFITTVFNYSLNGMELLIFNSIVLLIQLFFFYELYKLLFLFAHEAKIEKEINNYYIFTLVYCFVCILSFQLFIQFTGAKWMTTITIGYIIFVLIWLCFFLTQISTLKNRLFIILKQKDAKLE